MALRPATMQDIMAAKQALAPAAQEEEAASQSRLRPATMEDIQAARGSFVPKEQLRPASVKDFQRSSQQKKEDSFNVEEALPEILGSKKIGAVAVGAGHMLQNSIMGAGQRLGLVDEEQQNYNEAAMNALYKDEEYGVAALGGAVVGGLAEPVGFLLPVSKGKKLYDIAKVGAATGAVYGALDYTDPEESSAVSSVIGAVAGGVITPAVVKAYRMIAPVQSKVLTTSAEDTLRELEYNIAKASRGKKNKLDDVVAKVYRDMGLTTDNVSELVSASGRSEFKPINYALKGNRDSVIEEFETRAIKQKSWWQSKVKAYSSAPQKARDMASDTFTPIQQIIYDVSPEAGIALRKADFAGLMANKRWLDRIEQNGFKKFFKAMPKEAQKQLGYHVFNGNRRQAQTLMRQFHGDDGVAALEDTYKLQGDDIFNDMANVGYKIKKMDDYWHRQVIDQKLVSGHQRNMFAKALSKEKARLKRELSPQEVQKIHERYIMNKGRYATTSGALKDRTISHVDHEILDGYDDALTGLEKMFADHSEDIARRTFFKELGWAPKGGAKVDGSDIDDAISHFLNKMKITDPEKAFYVQSVLRSRFVDSREGVSAVVQVMKNLSYASTLGNFKSAITQLGDIVVPMQRYGIANTTKSIMRQLLGRTLVKKEDIGIMDAVMELAESKSISKLVLDKSMKFGGFNAFDRFGKEAGMDAALHKYYKMLKTPKGVAQFKVKYGDWYGGDIDQVIREIGEAVEQKKVGKGVTFFLFNELTDYQPLTKSEVPPNFWRGKGLLSARMFYAYKTFSLKQFNYIRTEMFRKIKSGDAATKAKGVKDLTTFLGLFLVVNGSLDQAKQMLFGKGEELETYENTIHNMLSILGASQFTADKLEEGNFFNAFWEVIKPVPIMQTQKIINDVGKGLVEEDSSAFIETILKNTPIVNKILDLGETFEVTPGTEEISQNLGG